MNLYFLCTVLWLITENILYILVCIKFVVVCPLIWTYFVQVHSVQWILTIACISGDSPKFTVDSSIYVSAKSGNLSVQSSMFKEQKPVIMGIVVTNTLLCPQFCFCVHVACLLISEMRIWSCFTCKQICLLVNKPQGE